MKLFKFQILSILACLVYVSSFQNDSQAGKLFSKKFLEDHEESYDFLDIDMNEKKRLLRSSNSMHYHQDSGLEISKHRSSSSKSSKISKSSKKASKMSSKKSSKKGSKKSSSRSNSKNNKKNSNKRSSSSKSSSRSSSIRLFSKKRASNSTKKKTSRSSSNSKKSSSSNSTTKAEVNIVSNLPPIKHIESKSSSSKDHAIINVMVINYNNEKKNSRISSNSASGESKSGSSSSDSAKEQVSAPTKVPTFSYHEIKETVKTYIETNISKSSKISQTDQVITISYVNLTTSESSKASSKGNVYIGSAKSASKAGCPYLGCDTGSKTPESGNYYNGIESMQDTDEKQEGKSIKTKKRDGEEQGDESEKSAKGNHNKSSNLNKGTSDIQNVKSGKEVESTGSKTSESGKYYINIGSVNNDTKTSLGKGAKSNLGSLDSNYNENVEDNTAASVVNSNDGRKSNGEKKIYIEKNGSKTISIVELSSGDRVSIPKSSVKSGVVTSPLPEVTNVNSLPTMPPSIEKGTAKGGKNTSTEKSANKTKGMTNNSNEEPHFNIRAEPLSTIQNVDKSSDSNIDEVIVNKISNFDNDKFICSSMDQTQVSTSHAVLKFNYLIEAASDNFQHIEEQLEEILIEGIAKDLCDEELIKEVNTKTGLTVISSCAPQEISNICRNVQGEISLEITNEALNRNVAQIESTLEKSLSAHMPDALNVSGLNRLVVTGIELKGEDFVLKGKVTPVQISKNTAEEQQVPQQEEQESNSASLPLSTSKQGKSSKSAKREEKYYTSSFSNSSSNSITMSPTYTSSRNSSSSSSPSSGYSLKSKKSKKGTYTSSRNSSSLSSPSSGYSLKSKKSKKGKIRR